LGDITREIEDAESIDQLDESFERLSDEDELNRVTDQTLTSHEQFLNQTMPAGEIGKLTQSMMETTQVEMLDTSGQLKLRNKPISQK
jgi:hypothetical protein